MTIRDGDDKIKKAFTGVSCGERNFDSLVLS